MVISLLLGCATQLEDSSAMYVSNSEMTIERQLTRVSMDLRGIRPSGEELEAVRLDPEALEEFVEAFLVHPNFGGRVRNLFAEIYLTRVEDWPRSASEVGLGDDEAAYLASVGEEPLWMLSQIAEEDLPYYTITTADWTMGNEVLGGIWPLDYPEGGEGWKKVHYTDSRPKAGVLASNALWWRYTSTLANVNRGRANAVSRILLCDDYLARSVTFSRDVNLLDDDAVRYAIQNNPGCVACHHTLEPIAAYFWGFFYSNDNYDMSLYRPEREPLWQIYGLASPGYYGQAGYTLEDLGQQIAADPRLPECVTQQVFEGLLRRRAELDDTGRLAGHRQDFLQGGQTLRSLFRSIVSSPAYLGDPSAGDAAVDTKFVDLELFGSQLEGLTGYRFFSDGYDMLRSDEEGLRTLGGGVDGVNNTAVASAANSTMLLVQQRLAEAASRYVVEEDFRNPDQARLLTEVWPSATPMENADVFARQIQRLHLLVFGRSVKSDGAEVEANFALWRQIYSVSADSYEAWAGLLSALFRDPDFLLY
jgi:hypothetical protein